MVNERVLYIPKEFIKDENLKEKIFFKETDTEEILGTMWRNYDFDLAEKKLYEQQCKLTKATFNKNEYKIKNIQNEIVYSTYAKMLAIRKVTEISKSAAGIDGVVWRKDSDKMKAAITLNKGKYKASPLKQFIFRDTKCSKERSVGIPTLYDRAMQVLYAFALEPVAEVTADRKSFAFRKRQITRASSCFYYGLPNRHRCSRLDFNYGYFFILRYNIS